MKNTTILLSENEIPTHFLNINYFLKKYLGKLPDPPLHPVTKKPVCPADLAPLFPMELIKQEVIRRGLSSNFFPVKSTRHWLVNRVRNLNISLKRLQ
jgi:predicted alternative tryptophan synthase beta-subunit